eukprot:CAMPEP_0176347310 /NCGR_PEP_ID=MMETSP0126-20121128/6951_1 /TAXON_ID=141414 ORGANISM="Strombidinopsis acuminatum, Strain SPMC142" /NCGR_SAMPLE_ID=MMETSP0126 /ASSEMBLY_ACC=CAM_ASM_000229 /LENGTH=52 /DNA_ID=CAMNT_0017695401 /DNA_START=310 /DNA_END=468 /DNA_ORIENTATION=+
MDKYLIFSHELEVHVIENAHKDIFKHGNRDWKFVPTKVMFRNKKNAEETTKT